MPYTKKIVMIAPHPVTFLNFRGDLAKDFIRQGYEVVAVVPSGGNNQQDYDALGIRCRTVMLNKTSLNPFSSLRYQRELVKILKEEKPNKVFAYASKPVIFGSIAATQAGIAESYSLVCGLGSVYAKNTFKNRILQKIVGSLYKKAFKGNKQVIFQNRDDIDEFVRRKYLPRKKCKLVGGSGVNMSKFKHTVLPKNISFIMVSRIIKEKGVREYFEAAKIVKTAFPQATFTYIGDYDKSYAKDFKELKAYIDGGIVKYIPTTKEVSRYLADAQVFVLPSYYREGIPRTLLEALSVGRPIITTNTPGCRETVLEYKNGLFTAPQNVDDLAEKMIWMIKHQEKLPEMGANSYNLCRKYFAIELVNKNMLSIMGATS